MSIPSAEQVEASNKFHSYTRGWKDGAAAKMKRPEFSGHRLQGIYDRGYYAGEVARQGAVLWAQVAFGFTPSILRDGTEIEEQG